MKALGLDLGTTTISAVVAEDTQVLTALTLKNDSFLSGTHSWERIQDPARILAQALQAVRTLLESYPDVACIGITGQMHGLVYLDEAGVPVSPLYTWQDGRGDQVYGNGKTYAAYLSELTGHFLATGYGMVTHFYNLKNGIVPGNAAVFCTIQDYLAMVLTEKTVPTTDQSDAASFGMFQVEKGCFDVAALEKAGISPDLLPTIAEDPCAGLYEGRIPVYTAIGDNQASFLGATGGDIQAMLVNVGTGGQFSVYTKKFMECNGLETRPFPGGFLLVGASLCCGRAYALLEGFLRETAQAMTGTAPESGYAAMEKLLSAGRPEDVPTLLPLFQGTRQEPTLRGSITGLSTENFTPRHLIWAMLEGIAGELHGLYLQYEKAGGKTAKLIGSGNGLRKNPALQKILSQKFGRELLLSEQEEEAAYGACLYAQRFAGVQTEQ